MVRRVASQVHKQVSRLMKGNAIKDEPAWYRAVLANPPLPLPAKAPPARSAYDQHHKDNKGRLRPYDPKPLPIYYLEDDIRRQFFRDHPFEAFRPVTLVERSVIGENREGLVSGKEWIRLRQRGRNPSPEDAVQFALNLHVHHDIPLTYAYARAVAQFRALRSEHHIASSVSLMEADFFGAVFEPSETAHTFEKEIRSLDTWERRAEMDEGAIAARKRWRAITTPDLEVREWTKGQEYVRLWKDGITPQYSPALTEPVAAQKARTTVSATPALVK